MDGLIDLILENPFFLVILIGGIISLLKGKSEKPEENESTTNRPKPVQAKKPFEHSHQKTRTRSPEKVVSAPISSKSIEELREEQMLRFTGQTDSEEDQRETETHRAFDVKEDKVSEVKFKNRNEKAFKRNFNKSLTRKGLVNSVIMAEVLGAPRARRPYQSVIAKRRNR